VVVTVGVLVGVMPGRAGAAVFVELLRTSAHPRELVGAEVDAWTATHHPPLYLVPERLSTTFATAKGAPRRAPYIRLREIDWRRPNGSTARISLPCPNVANREVQACRLLRAVHERPAR
jgi:hypothetical protein